MFLVSGISLLCSIIGSRKANEEFTKLGTTADMLSGGGEIIQGKPTHEKVYTPGLLAEQSVVAPVDGATTQTPTPTPKM